MSPKQWDEEWEEASEVFENIPKIQELTKRQAIQNDIEEGLRFAGNAIRNNNRLIPIAIASGGSTILANLLYDKLMRDKDLEQKSFEMPVEPLNQTYWY